MQKVFKSLVSISILLYAIWYFLPFAWHYLYDEQTLNLMSWNGLNSSFDIYGPFSYVLGLSFLASSIGLFFFKIWARIGYLGITIINVLAVPFMGVAIQGGYDAMVGYIVTLINGAIIAMMYLTSISDMFRKLD